MAVLIPALGSCVARMTSGERRLAERLQDKLDEDYLLWYDVPIGPLQTHPDFIVLHPRRGLLVLETKDWHLETIREANRDTWSIAPNGEIKHVANPLTQARHCALQIVQALEADKQLVQTSGPHQGKLAFPWGYGVVLTRISRKDFEEAQLGQAIAPHLVICRDEMLEDCDPEALQKRLWEMYPHAFGKVMSLPQLDRVRWILFPQVRIPEQQSLLIPEQEDELPDVMRVMDLHQEQLARSLGSGHRIIHGVAGSGKTMILGYRAEYLAMASHADKPVLVLCYNKALAAKLESVFQTKGISDRVHARNFHKWCSDQLTAFGQTRPDSRLPIDAKMADMVQRVITGVERKQIPSGQYLAVMVDEGHDFKPEWLKLVTQMVDPSTNNLLVLYDDAQSIYDRSPSKPFSFKSVGIQAQGRTTILKINYRNTQEILKVALRAVAGLLNPEDKDEDGVPLLRPMSGGRSGEMPVILQLPNPREEAFKIAEQLQAAQREGYAWSDMAVLCPTWEMMGYCEQALGYRNLPFIRRDKAPAASWNENRITVMTMHASKGLEFPLVALHGLSQLGSHGETEREQAKVFYVAATRATQKLIVTVSGNGVIAQRMRPSPSSAPA